MENLIHVVNIPPQTHSSLQLFDLCPRQYDAKYRSKTVKFEQNYEGQWGDAAHMHLENYIKASGKYQYPDEQHRDSGQNMRDYQWVGESLLTRAQARGGYVLAERKFGIGYDRDTADYWDKSGWLRGKIDITIIYPSLREAEVFDLKGLPLDTKLPTPSGWTTMQDVQVGDKLFSRDGKQCTVRAKSEIKNLPCFRIDFDDATSVTCDTEHLWTLDNGSVVNVLDLRTSDRIPLASSIQCEEAQLPIDPYVLGLWLADGKHTSGEITKPDADIWEEVQRRGYTVSHDYSAKASDGKCRVHTVYGLRKQLRESGLLGNKHIPTAYLRAGYDARLDLLRGLMDGDGSANAPRRQAVYVSCNEALAAQVHELALSLGQRAVLRTVRQEGFGKVVYAKWVVFSPIGVNPFLLPRKAEKIAHVLLPNIDRMGREWGPRKYRRVVAVVPVDSVPTQCISVDSADNTYLCTEHFIPTHNTGKKKDDPLQVDLYSVSAMLDYSNVDRVRAGYIWAKLPPAKAIDKPLTYTRDDIPRILNTFDIKTQNVKQAWATGVFPPKPNPLCGWCDVTTCEFYKPSPKRKLS